MDDITRTQQSFARKAMMQPEHRFEDVYHIIWREDWIRSALSHVLGNKGSRTPGIDGVTRRRFDDEAYKAKFIRELRETLRSGDYRPEPVRRIYIPKPNGKQRPLGIPTVRDRVVQMLLKMLMEPIWESNFLDCSSGFRPNRRTMDCIAMCYRLINGAHKYYWVVEGDITGCFDNIQQDILLELVGRRIHDRRIASLIEQFLKSGFMEEQLFKKTEAGTPQGGLFSPLLANIYLHEMDKYWWEKYGNLDVAARQKRRYHKQGNCRLIRYADDFVLLTNGPKEEAYRLREEFQTLLWDKLRLELSEEKTRVTHAEEGFDFLGYNVRRYTTPQNGTKPITLVKPSEKSIKRLKAKISQMTAHAHAPDNPMMKLKAVNAVLRGWGNYYQHVNAKAVLHSLDWWANNRMLHWLADHHRSGVMQALQRYQHMEEERKNLAVATPSGELIFLYVMGDKPLTRYADRKRGNPYAEGWETQLEEQPELADLDLDHTWNGGEYHEGWSTARTARLQLDKGSCVICGTAENVEVHHLDARKWGQRRQGNDEVNRLATLCKICHIKVHQGTIMVNGNGEPGAVKVASPVRREA